MNVSIVILQLYCIKYVAKVCSPIQTSNCHFYQKNHCAALLYTSFCLTNVIF